MGAESFIKVGLLHVELIAYQVSKISVEIALDYSPSLKDVALLEVTQLTFLIFHTFVCKFFPTN